MRRTSILIACLACLACGSAKADWEYAKWGMTSEQIARASAGSVSVLPVAEEVKSEEMNLTRKAEGVFTEGTLKLKVQFAFDTATGGLKMVAYRPSESSQNEALKTWLMKRHGPPTHTSKLQQTTTLTWSGPDEITFMESDGYAASVMQSPAH